MIFVWHWIEMGLEMYTVLAAWFRIKYPHIAIGAVAASAPILQFEDIVPTDTFYRIVSSDFKVCGISPLLISNLVFLAQVHINGVKTVCMFEGMSWLQWT